MLVQVQIFPSASLSNLQEMINDWLKKHIQYITVRDIKFVAGEYGRYIAMVWYEKDTAEEFIDKMVKGELE